ncbi:MAG: polyprenyl synthetase family protein [Aeromicrobium sp.]|uniref:polyprenyl synthetase family protein n=1 Tax=Aeromicrobium sp. TaxID=1871063 RepID=UPI0039E23B30
MNTDALAADRDVAAVDAALADFVARQRSRWAGVHADVADFLDAAVNFIADGKRIRPLFCLAGWRAATGRDPEDPAPVGVVTAAAAWEWLQASALVHDDLMDASDTRRGRPSVHRAFEASHRAHVNVGDPVRHGAAAAILLGDLMLSWADEMLRHAGTVDPHLDPTPLAQAFTIFDTCKTEVTLGQFLDVAAQTRREVSAEAALLVVTFKSAKYTIERPLHLGAALGGGDTCLLERLTEVALPLGAAFQLRDDVLGVFGDPVTTGKPSGDDLREGKRTLLVARALDRLDPPQREQLIVALGTDGGVDTARHLIVSSGALADVEQEITRYADAARAAADLLPQAARSTLEPLIDRSVRRNH